MWRRRQLSLTVTESVHMHWERSSRYLVDEMKYVFGDGQWSTFAVSNASQPADRGGGRSEPGH